MFIFENIAVQVLTYWFSAQGNFGVFFPCLENYFVRFLYLFLLLVVMDRFESSDDKAKLFDSELSKFRRLIKGHEKLLRAIGKL